VREYVLVGEDDRVSTYPTDEHKTNARPVVPDLPSGFDTEAVRQWSAAKLEAFIWDAKQAGFTDVQAVFLYERYRDKGIGQFGF
jgi:hypothetical protein